MKKLCVLFFFIPLLAYANNPINYRTDSIEREATFALFNPITSENVEGLRIMDMWWNEEAGGGEIIVMVGRDTPEGEAGATLPNIFNRQVVAVFRGKFISNWAKATLRVEKELEQLFITHLYVRQTEMPGPNSKFAKPAYAMVLRDHNGGVYRMDARPGDHLSVNYSAAEKIPGVTYELPSAGERLRYFKEHYAHARVGFIKEVLRYIRTGDNVFEWGDPRRVLPAQAIFQDPRDVYRIALRSSAYAPLDHTYDEILIMKSGTMGLKGRVSNVAYSGPVRDLPRGTFSSGLEIRAADGEVFLLYKNQNDHPQRVLVAGTRVLDLEPRQLSRRDVELWIEIRYPDLKRYNPLRCAPLIGDQSDIF